MGNELRRWKIFVITLLVFFVLGVSLIIPVFYKKVEPSITPLGILGSENVTIGEMGRVGVTQMNWHNITFNNTYDSVPVVIAVPNSNHRGSGNSTTGCTNCNDGGGCNDDACDGIIPVINWIGTTGFNCTIMYDNGTDANPPVGSESGVYDYLAWWAINTSAITEYDWIDAGVATGFDNTLTGDASKPVTFNKVLSGDPYVFLCPQTYSQSGNLPSAYWADANPSTSGFNVYGGVHSSTDDCDEGLGHENIGWLAIDTSECLINGFESGTESISSSAWTDISHTATEPRILVMQNDENGAQDPKYCGARKVYSGDPEIHYCEQDGDGVCNGHNGETIVWACLDGDDDNENITAPNPIDTEIDSITPYDQTTSPLIITATSSGGSPSNVTLYYRYNSTNSSWGSNYEQTINDLSPDYWWKLDGDETDSADAGDSDGGSDPSWVDPIVPGSSATYCGDYSSDDTNLPNKGDINDGTTYDRSLSVWFNADTIDTDDNGEIIWEEGGGTNWLSIYVHEESGEDRIYFTMGEGGSGGVVDYMYYGPISTGVTYHLGVWVDYSAEEMHMYINGTEVDNDTGFNTGTSLSSHTSNPSIGGPDGNPRGWDMNTVSGSFDGRIQDMIYWGDESPLLTGSDFQDIYNAGITESIPWVEWSDASNPDTASPWSWDFNFPNGTGYYQFHSIGKSATETESAPSISDANCSYNESVGWTQSKKGFFTFFNNMNHSQNDKGHFLFGNNLNFSQNKKGFFLFKNELNFTQSKLGFFTFNNNMNHTQNSFGFFTFSNNLNFTQEDLGYFTFKNNQNYTRSKTGFFLFSNNQNYSQDKLGWFTFLHNQNFTQNNKGWFIFNNNLNFTQNSRGHFTFNNNMNYSKSKVGWFTFFNDQNYSQNSRGFFTFRHNQNFTRVKAGWFTFDNDINYSRNTAGWFVFNNNMNYSQNNKGFFIFFNNLNFTQNTRAWFIFENEQNFTRDTAGWFTFRNDSNWTRNMIGWFNFSNLTADWDRTQIIAWRIVNLSGITILNLSTEGNISIRGTFFQTSVEPSNVAWCFNNTLWLTEDGDLHITGQNIPVADPNWVIINSTGTKILKFKDGDIQITGNLFENV